MSRLKERAERQRKEAQQQVQVGFWPDLCQRIDSGQVIPIISNAVFCDQIFDIDGDQILGISPEEENPDGWSIEEQLADAWAGKVGFPLSEQHWLPRVALYDRVVNRADDRASKTSYVDWLKDSLLFLAEEDRDIDPEKIEELRDDFKRLSFSDVAVELRYPKPIKGYTDPLQHLAKLRLPIYITTSYFDFLERAIDEDRRKPRTQICFWAEEPTTYVNESHKTAYDFEPTPENPLVYHIFGLESYPESMVLNEDDYFDFLVKISQDPHQEKPIIPLYLRKALTQSSLILLGYRLRDWDFRVVFRGLISAMPSALRKFNLAIQLDPHKQQRVASADQIRNYLEKYFNSADFIVEWDSAHGFVETLWKTWDQWRR